MNKNQGHFKWRSYRLYKRLLNLLCSRLYRDTNRDLSRSIMVAGTARSGTTWLADMIAGQISCRVMFEPFHCEKVELFSRFHYFQYMRPTEPNNDLHDYCRKVFSGDIRNSWIDSKIERIYPQRRLIKDIRANLFLNWLHHLFPEVPLLFIIRHPCAVVLSRLKLSWATDADIEPMLSQSKLVDDFLADKVDLIKRTTNPEQKHAIIWCVTNLVPIRQFNSNGLIPIFYENLCLQPEVEIPRIFRAVGGEYQESVFDDIKKPSTTTVSSSAVVSGENIIARWQTELSPQQIDNILATTREFGLDYLYDSSPRPLVEHF